MTCALYAYFICSHNPSSLPLRQEFHTLIIEYSLYTHLGSLIWDQMWDKCLLLNSINVQMYLVVCHISIKETLFLHCICTLAHNTVSRGTFCSLIQSIFLLGVFYLKGYYVPCSRSHFSGLLEEINGEATQIYFISHSKINCLSNGSLG